MGSSILWLDLETRSQVDLIKHGLARYSQDPSTQIICSTDPDQDDREEGAESFNTALGRPNPQGHPS